MGLCYSQCVETRISKSGKRRTILCTDLLCPYIDILCVCTCEYVCMCVRVRVHRCTCVLIDKLSPSTRK